MKKKQKPMQLMVLNSIRKEMPPAKKIIKSKKKKRLKKIFDREIENLGNCC
jgi:hypothetical protein